MLSFGFKRACPLVGITQRRLPHAPVPIEVGRHYETDGAPFRKRWGTITTEGRKVPHFPSKPPPTCVVIAPHLSPESVPHFARNLQFYRRRSAVTDVTWQPGAETKLPALCASPMGGSCSASHTKTRSTSCCSVRTRASLRLRATTKPREWSMWLPAARFTTPCTGDRLRLWPSARKADTWQPGVL